MHIEQFNLSHPLSPSIPTMNRSATMESFEGEEDKLPRVISKVYIALEYIEAETNFNFYIKKITDPPTLVHGRKRRSCARMYVVKGLSKTNWMGRPRIISNAEMEERHPHCHRTMAVRKRNPTVFNEFFTSSVEVENFHKTLLRIHLVDVDKAGREVIVGETDYWIDTNPINRFTEFALTMRQATPDLGEFEFGMTYLPTAGRVTFEDMKATNLSISSSAQYLQVHGYLYLKKSKEEEVLSSEINDFSEESAMFPSKIFFDVSMKELVDATIILQLVELIEDEKKRVLGEVLLSHSNPSCDRLHWKKMLMRMREKHTETHKITPAI